MTIHKITEELITKFLDGDCTLEEKASVILWYNRLDGDEDLSLKITHQEKDKLKDLMLNKINERIDFSDLGKTKKLKSRDIIYWLTGIAASLLIFFGVAFYNSTKSKTIATNEKIKEARLIVLENQGGTLYKRQLEDGTLIWLSPGATVEFPDHFSELTREVKMTGKVFFEVAKNPNKPFLIYAGGVTTKVLGTSFLIEAEKGKDTKVAVVTGRVVVTVTDKEEENIVLIPQQKGVFKVADKILKVEPLAEKSEVQMWKKPKLSFDNINIGEVVKR